MEAAEVVYENLMHRNKRSILVIISNAAAIDRMKKQGIETTVVYKFRMGIEFIEENSLSWNKRNSRVNKIPEVHTAYSWARYIVYDGNKNEVKFNE